MEMTFECLEIEVKFERFECTIQIEENPTARDELWSTPTVIFDVANLGRVNQMGDIDQRLENGN